MKMISNFPIDSFPFIYFLYNHLLRFYLWVACITLTTAFFNGTLRIKECK